MEKLAQELANFRDDWQKEIWISKLGEKKSPGDVAVVLVVLGRRGAGKSAVMRDITAWLSLDAPSQEAGQSQIMSKVFDGQEFIFIDTPEFEYDTSVKEALLNNMKLVSKIPNSISIAGVICISGSEPPLSLEFEQEFLSWLFAFCGDEFLSQLTLITTYDGNSGGSTYENHEQYLERWKKLWAPLLTRARTYHYPIQSEDSRMMIADHEHAPCSKAAENLVRDYANLLRQTRQIPQFSNELASGVPVRKTKAARVLYPTEVGRPKPSELIEKTSQSRPEPFELIENASQSDPQFLGHVPPELLPGMLFGNLLVQPKLAASGLPTAVPCPICNNFTEYVSEINMEKARCRASAGCLGCRLITRACEKSIQEDDRDRSHRHFSGLLGLDWTGLDTPIQSSPKLKRFSACLGRLANFLYRLVVQPQSNSSPSGSSPMRPLPGHLEPENSLQVGTQDTRSTARISPSPPTIRFDSKLQEYEIFTTAEVQDTFHGSIRQMRIPFQNSESPESFDLISTWIQDCCRKHDNCPSSNTQLPSRVLDIDCSKGIKLRSGTGIVGRYCALSHCWGSSSNNPARTIKATLASRQSKIEEVSLSKTFREAIALARHLSIQYIWIDSLCIIQDDPEDWARESANMTSIYQNAYLVIAATQAEHGGIGCFSARPDTATLCFEISQVNGQDAPVYIRTKTDHLHFNPTSMYNANHDRRHPLLSRAWCLQERLLATRLVHFAHKELVWECRTETLCECGSLAGDGRTGSAFKRRWAINHELGELFDLWHKTLRLYTSLNIMYESDRLPALSGLAKQLQARGCGEYVAGVWIKNIFADLMWSAPTSRVRPEEWRAPSWSWACGVGFDVYFNTQRDNSPESHIDVENLRGQHHPSKTPGGEVFRTKLVSVDYELNGPDPTGKLNTATLTIAAPAVDVLLVRSCDQWKLQKGGKGLTALHLDCHGDFEGQDIPLLCAWVGTIWDDTLGSDMHPQILLLQPSRGLGGKAAATGCYERVGMLNLQNWRSEEEDVSVILEWFEDAEVHCIKIV